MENLTLESFKEKIMNFEETQDDWKFQGELPAIIKYTADWCSPCKKLTPVLESLSKEYDGKINIYEINVDEEAELSYLFNIKSVPTLLFIPINNQPQMYVGSLTESKLKEIINDVLL